MTPEKTAEFVKQIYARLCEQTLDRLEYFNGASLHPVNVFTQMQPSFILRAELDSLLAHLGAKFAQLPTGDTMSEVQHLLRGVVSNSVLWMVAHTEESQETHEGDTVDSGVREHLDACAGGAEVVPTAVENGRLMQRIEELEKQLAEERANISFAIKKPKRRKRRKSSVAVPTRKKAVRKATRKKATRKKKTTRR